MGGEEDQDMTQAGFKFMSWTSALPSVLLSLTEILHYEVCLLF